MELYILRHGIADEAAAGQPDAARQLTEEGRKKTAAVVRTARRAGMNPTLILSSPYDRAMQTATVAVKELDYRGEILQTAALIPAGSPEGVWNVIRDHGHEEAILLAGHEPLLGELVAYLLASPSLQVEIKKSALVRIDFESLRAAPRGVLRWMVTPALA